LAKAFLAFLIGLDCDGVCKLNQSDANSKISNGG